MQKHVRVQLWQMQRSSESARVDELRDRFFAAGLPPFSTADLRSKLAAAGGDIETALRQAGVTVPAKRSPAPAPAAPLLPTRVERSDAPVTRMAEPPRVELTIPPSPARVSPSKAVVAEAPPKELSFIGGTVEMLSANKLYLLLVLCPVSAASEYLGFRCVFGLGLGFKFGLGVGFRVSEHPGWPQNRKPKPSPKPAPPLHQPRRHLLAGVRGHPAPRRAARRRDRAARAPHERDHRRAAQRDLRQRDRADHLLLPAPVGPARHRADLAARLHPLQLTPRHGQRAATPTLTNPRPRPSP